MKKVLLTGVAGFIGSRIAQSLVNRGCLVTGIDNLKTGYLDNVPKAVDFVLGDCADPNIFDHKLIADVAFDTIIHFAGQSSGEISFDDPVQDLGDNCVSTLNLLQFARKSLCKRFILASSMSVYGDVQADLVSETHAVNPISMYAVGKLASEHYMRIYQRYDISSISLRLFNVYGPGQNMSNLRQGMVSIYLAQALSKGNIEVKGSANRFRDFVYIDDVTEVVDGLIDRGFDGFEIYNICTGVKTKVSELLDCVSLALGTNNISVRYVDGTPGDQYGIVGDNSKLAKALGKTQFVDIKTGINKFVSSL